MATAAVRLALAVPEPACLAGSGASLDSRSAYESVSCCGLDERAGFHPDDTACPWLTRDLPDLSATRVRGRRDRLDRAAAVFQLDVFLQWQRSCLAVQHERHGADLLPDRLAHRDRPAMVAGAAGRLDSAFRVFRAPMIFRRFSSTGANARWRGHRHSAGVAPLLLGLSSANLRREHLASTLTTVGIMAHELRTPLVHRGADRATRSARSAAPARHGARKRRNLKSWASRLHGLVRNMNHQIDTEIANAKLLELPRYSEMVGAERNWSGMPWRLPIRFRPPASANVCRSIVQRRLCVSLVSQPVLAGAGQPDQERAALAGWPQIPATPCRRLAHRGGVAEGRGRIVVSRRRHGHRCRRCCGRFSNRFSPANAAPATDWAGFLPACGPQRQGAYQREVRLCRRRHVHHRIAASQPGSFPAPSVLSHHLTLQRHVLFHSTDVQERRLS